jgi:hypothetical protein
MVRHNRFCNGEIKTVDYIGSKKRNMCPGFYTAFMHNRKCVAKIKRITDKKIL